MGGVVGEDGAGLVRKMRSRLDHGVSRGTLLAHVRGPVGEVVGAAMIN